MDLHRPTGAWYFRRLHQARAFTIGIILKFELLSVRYQENCIMQDEEKRDSHRSLVFPHYYLKSAKPLFGISETQ
jgi:hypothetical protein